MGAARRAGRPAGRRTVRDWAVDLVLFGFAVVVWRWRRIQLALLAHDARAPGPGR